MILKNVSEKLKIGLFCFLPRSSNVFCSGSDDVIYDQAEIAASVAYQ